MNQKKINGLMKEILKFRDRPHSGRDKSDPPKSTDDLCDRDWALILDLIPN